MLVRFFFLLLTFLCLSSFQLHLFGQAKSIIIFDESIEHKIPFVHLVVNNSEHFHTDMDGKISLPSYANKILIKHPFYHSVDFNIHDIPDTIYLKNINSKPLNTTSEEAIKIIKGTLSEKNFLSNERKKYYYKSYNKFSVTPQKRREKNKFMDLTLKFFSYDFEQFQKTHLFLMESVSEMHHWDRIRRKEKIIGIKTTGIELPSTYTNFIHPNPFAVYKNHINIANSKYISPLCDASYLTYAYKIVDSTFIDKDTIFTIQYYPLPGKSLNSISGLLYINSRDNALQYFYGAPLDQKLIRIEAAQEYKKIQSDWFPENYKTDIVIRQFGPEKMDLTMTGKSFIFDFKSLEHIEKEYYNETILQYDSSAYSMPEFLWKKYRQDSLSPKDISTFNYYDSTRIQKRQEAFLKLGERIYYGELPIGKINLDLNKIIYTNYLEGLRLGLGFHTNKKFSPTWRIGAYAGYGFKDEKFKYGGDITYLTKLKSGLTAGIGYRKDIYEAGAQFFPFDFYQYSTEPLRKYRLSILDYIDQFSGNLGFRPLKYLNINAGVSVESHYTIYNYQYKEKGNNTFNYTEFSTGFRYAFGEEYIRTPQDNFYLGSNFPVLWVNITKGLKDVYDSDASYTKFDIKLQQTFKFFRFGTTGIQLIAGLTSGSPPYSKLYNMRGSLRDLSVVIHNCFETMSYNEFLSDRFVALFYSHDFGKFFTPDADFRPNLVMIHNLGFGTIKNPSYHKINFKTMERGFFESGVFLKNLIVLNLSGLRTGFGVGLFARYGPNSYRLIGDNLVFKISTNFLM